MGFFAKVGRFFGGNVAGMVKSTIGSVAKGAANTIGNAITGLGRSSLGSAVMGAGKKLYNSVGNIVGKDNLNSAVSSAGEFLRDDVFKPLVTRAAGVLGKGTVEAIGQGLSGGKHGLSRSIGNTILSTVGGKQAKDDSSMRDVTPPRDTVMSGAGDSTGGQSGPPPGGN